ncbi:MAG: hypothetical protein JWQ43_619 [Glaciihabitans sp.]|nr:hypothetical protein [Glaciihabitans sp.]
MAVQNGSGPSPEPTTGQGGTPTPPSGTPSPPAPTPGCPPATVTVTDSSGLEEALRDATPGAVIQLSPGRYEGSFVATTSGTANAPITLCGSKESILDGGGTSEGYVFHLDNVSYWVLDGFAVQNGQKGVMADTTTHSLIQGLSVSQIGDEGIHLRNFSTDNTVANNTISDTGTRKAKYGEGVYVGTAESNWCDISNCKPDASDRNLITGNTIFNTTAESIDVKEGTTGGTISDNTLDGSGITGADSWVDVKGNSWVIAGNVGTNSPGDGFQTHEILDGWGIDNVFRANSAAVNGPGVGYSMDPESANVVQCDNVVSGAKKGLTNSTCTK